MLNPYREFEYWLKDVMIVGTAVALDAVTVVVAAGEGGIVLGGATQPAIRSDAMMHTRIVTDKKHDGQVFLFILSSNFAKY